MSGKPVAAEGGLTAVSPQDFSLMNVPIFYASSLNVYVPGNDAALLFMRPHPGLIPGLEDNTAVIVA